MSLARLFVQFRRLPRGCVGQRHAPLFGVGVVRDVALDEVFDQLVAHADHDVMDVLGVDELEPLLE